jgi:hypothetical protein
MTEAAADGALGRRKPIDLFPAHLHIERNLRRLPDGGALGNWYGCALSSVFQPIVDPDEGRIVGHEAFLRCYAAGQCDISPWLLFSGNAEDARLVALDRLCRTLHALNYRSASGDGLLFLNVHGRLLAAVSDDHGRFFRQVLGVIGLPRERVVIETPLAAGDQPDMLAFVLRNYRANGFQVAVNVSSAAQWQALSAAGCSFADFIKIPASQAGVGIDAGERLKCLDALRGQARLIVTRIEARISEPLPSATWLQGLAYGAPLALNPGPVSARREPRPAA